MTAVKLRGWWLSDISHEGESAGGIFACGVINGHPKVKDGESVRTSKIRSVDYDMENERLLVVTESDSTYELDLAFILMSRLLDTVELIRSFGITDLNLEQCTKAVFMHEDALNKKVCEVLGTNDLYLQVIGAYAYRAFINDGANVRSIDVACHKGLQQDSYLIKDFKSNLVDFRYYSRDGEICPYQVPINLRVIWIENISNNNVFVMGNYEIMCAAGEITTISIDQISCACGKRGEN